MSTRFTANNFTSIKDLFIDRILYEAVFSYPDSPEYYFKDPKAVKDYWKYENVLYGKVDKKFSTIAVIKSSLESYKQSSDTIYALPEVLESYKEMKNLFMQRSKNGQIAKDPFLEDLKIYRAYNDADVEYNVYVTKIIDQFNKMINKKQMNSQIKNVKDYVGLFFENFFETNEISFLTRSAYYLSNKVSSLSSGLSIEISDLNPSDNKQKQDFFESRNFGFYTEAAVNFGFTIDKNIPWRLNYDLSSPVNGGKLFTSPTQPDPVQGYLSKYFYKLYFEDIDYLLSTALLGYNTFVNDFPNYKDGLCIFTRNKVTPEEAISDIFGIPYWIDKFIRVKNKENNVRYNEKEIEKIIFNAIDLDYSQANRYIQTKFDSPYTLEGSTTFELLKKKLKENNNFPLDRFSDYVIMLIKRSTDKIY